MSIVQDAMQAVMKTAVALAPDGWLPGGHPDPLARHKHGLIGAPISRIDGKLKVAGQARFAAEIPLPGLTFAALHYATIAKGRIADIDTSAAETAPGVVLVMTHDNAPPLKAPPAFGAGPKAAGGNDIAPMQDTRIHWNGQPVALVLAETLEQAEHAQSLIRVTYAAEPGATSLAAAKAAGTKLGKFQGEKLQLEVKDAERLLAESPHKVDAIYRTPPHNHNPIELHAATLAWEDGNLRLHDATQAVGHTAWTLSQVFGIEESQVHVTSPFVGGGFGSKTLWHHQILAAAAAKLAGRPVRIVLSREGVFRVVGGRALTEQRVAIGAQNDGAFDAIIHTGVTTKTPHNVMTEPFIVATRSLYDSKSFKLEVDTVDLNMVANTFMRAPGEAVGTFALESAIDELAHAIGMDPIELRLRNEPAKDPTQGLPFSQRNTERAFRDGAARFGWQNRSATPRSRREGDWLIGMGTATATYPYYRMPGGAARITLKRDATARVEVAAHEMGMGTATVHTQVAAERLGLPFESVEFGYGDTEFPGVVLAGGSQQTASIGAGIIAAHRALIKELLKLAGNASPLAGLTPDDVGGFGSGLSKLDDPSRHESYASILGRAQRDELVVEAQAPMPLELQHWSMHSHGAMFCEVRVNAITGEIRVSRFLGSFDCGRILNAKTASSQFRGGIIMGIGMALMEEAAFDERSGRIMNPSLAEYHVPVQMDVPEIDIIWTDEPDPHAPMGARGIGEIGITGVGAAVANAVFNATGKRARDLPITLDKVF
jgi:xanthine dehydrogenase YagR molybdenum-binding subunit